MKKTLMKSLAMAFVGSLLVAGSAMALPTVTLDFGMIAPTSGTISYAGGSAPLVGSSIEVDNVAGLDMNGNANLLLDVFNGRLDFTTGAATGAWEWGGGTSSVTVTGTVDANNNHVLDTGDISGVLLTGSFGSASLEGNGTTKIVFMDFFDHKNPEVLRLFGLPQSLYEGTVNLTLAIPSSVQKGGQFTSTALYSGDIVNNPVPEPATMLLLGTGLVGLAGSVRRKAKKA